MMRMRMNKCFSPCRECTANAKSDPTEPKRRKRPVKEKALIVCDICGKQSQSQGRNSTGNIFWD